MPGMLFGLNLSNEAQAGTDPVASAGKAEQLGFDFVFWSSFSPYRRGRTVAGPDTVVEERRVERDLP